MSHADLGHKIMQHNLLNVGSDSSIDDLDTLSTLIGNYTYRLENIVVIAVMPTSITL